MSNLAGLVEVRPALGGIKKAAPRGERARIEALIAREEARVRRAFRRFLDDMRSPEVRRQVRVALERDGIEGAMRVVDAHVARMGTALSQSFQAAGYAEAEALARYFGGSRVAVAISFDPSYPRAAALMRSNRLALVREFTRLQRDATRSALIEALRAGSGPVQTARAFRDSIGLTNYQRGVVANYRRQLESGDARVLTRDLRDRRFDPTVRRAAQEGEALGARRINRMVEQYRNRYLQLRAETIARTETLRTVNIARDEALTQMTEQLDLPREAVTRTWRATQDARTRDTHADMDGQEKDFETPFESPSGAQMMYPGDTELGAGPEEIINCLLGETPVETSGLTAIARGWFNGEAVTIETARGRKIAVTANHPVMTNLGWRPATHLDEGNQLVCCAGINQRGVARGNTEHIPLTVKQMYDALTVTPIIRERLSVNFHGDVLDSDVNIKLIAGDLLLKFDLPRLQQIKEEGFRRPHVHPLGVSRHRAPSSDAHRIFLATTRAVRSVDLLASLFISHVSPLDGLCLRVGAWPYSKPLQGIFRSSSAHIELFAEVCARQTSLVELDEVVGIRRHKFSGHVYSPQTISGMFLTQGILNHNCRCVLIVSVVSPE